MTKTISYVSLFNNVDPVTKKSEWRASFHVGDVDASAKDLPAFDIDLFKYRVSKKGVEHLVSKRPLIVEHGDIVTGNKPGKFFTNIASIGVPPPVDTNALDALLAAKGKAEPASAEPADAEPADAEPAGDTL